MTGVGGSKTYHRRVAREDYLDEDQEIAAVADIRRYLAARREGQYSARWLRRLRARSKSAEALLVTSHLRLVVSVAARYRTVGRIDRDDLVQEGNLALMMAVEPFIAHGHGRFGGYAYGRVRAAVGLAADLAGHPATVPQRLLRQARQVERLRRELEDKRRDTDRSQLCWILGVSEARLQELERISATPLLLSTPLGDGTLTVADTLYYRSEQDAVSNEAEAWSAASALEVYLKSSALTRPESAVLRARFKLQWFGLDWRGRKNGHSYRASRPSQGPLTSFAHIAIRLRISETQARVLYRRAIKKMQDIPELALLATDPTQQLHATEPDDVESSYLTRLGHDPRFV